MIVLNEKEGLKCGVSVDRVQLEHISQEGSKWEEGSLVNVKDLQLDCARVWHEILFVPVLTYDNETMLCKEKKSRIRAVQMDNL